MYRAKKEPEITTEVFLETIIDRVACKWHKKPKGEACHILPGMRHPLYGICNWRAKKAGFNAPIQEKSMRRTTTPQKPHKGKTKQGAKA